MTMRHTAAVVFRDEIAVPVPLLFVAALLLGGCGDRKPPALPAVPHATTVLSEAATALINEGAACRQSGDIPGAIEAFTKPS